MVYAGFGLSRKSDRMSPSGIEFRMLDREYDLHCMLHLSFEPHVLMSSCDRLTALVSFLCNHCGGCHHAPSRLHVRS